MVENRFDGLQQVSDGTEFHSPFHRQHSPSPAATATRQFRDIGTFETLDLPQSWSRFDSKTITGIATTFTNFKNASTQITVLPHNLPVAAQATAKICQLLNERIDAKTPKLLYSDVFDSAGSDSLFRAIAPILGSSLVGNNQIVNPPTENDGKQPNFHMEKAQLRNVSDKTVLEVSGWYAQRDNAGQIKHGADGPLKRYYDGIFALDGLRAGGVSELYLTAEDASSYKQAQKIFNRTLATLKWK